MNLQLENKLARVVGKASCLPVAAASSRELVSRHKYLLTMLSGIPKRDSAPSPPVEERAGERRPVYFSANLALKRW
jgi:hypothetical protein